MEPGKFILDGDYLLSRGKDFRSTVNSRYRMRLPYNRRQGFRKLTLDMRQAHSSVPRLMVIPNRSLFPGRVPSKGHRAPHSMINGENPAGWRRMMLIT